MQQPFGHVLLSHEQEPVVLSHRLFAQVVQAAPPAPHCEADWDEYTTQVLPLQQPFGQELAVQPQVPVVALHACPLAHAPQATPAAPQEPFVSDA